MASMTEIKFPLTWKPSLRQLQQLIARGKQKQPAAAAEPEQLSFPQVIELYLNTRRHDYRLTQANPDQLPKKRQLTRTTLNTIESHLNELGRFVGNKPWLGELQAEAELKRYAAHLQQKLIKGEYKAWTVNTKLRKIHTFFEWCVSSGHLDRTPRNLKTATSSFATKKGGEALKVEVIQKLWEAFPPQKAAEGTRQPEVTVSWQPEASVRHVSVVNFVRTCFGGVAEQSNGKCRIDTLQDVFDADQYQVELILL